MCRTYEVAHPQRADGQSPKNLGERSLAEEISEDGQPLLAGEMSYRNRRRWPTDPSEIRVAALCFVSGW